MAQARWRAVITNSAYKPLGEIYSADGISFSRSLNKLATVSFNVPFTVPNFQTMADLAGYVKLYRNTSLQFFGPLITSEETADREKTSMALTAADAGWILQKRLAGKSSTGQQFTTATNVAAISKTLIDTENTAAETGIKTDAVTLTAGSARTYTAGPYRPVLQCIAELGSALDGFDWRFVPIENWVNGAVSGSKIGYFDAQTLIGVDNKVTVFEYGAGTRTNVYGYSFNRSRDGQATRVYLPNGDFSIVAGPATNTAAEAAGWGRLEDVLSLPDITDSTMQGQIVAEHTAVRGYPRQIIKITPHIDPGVTGRVPQPFVDYNVGDTVYAKIIAQGTTRFQGAVRVYGINVSIEAETGFERVELILEDES
jgi:hypothetical protein